MQIPNGYLTVGGVVGAGIGVLAALDKGGLYTGPSATCGLVVGIVITWISTFFATQRYLNLRTDDLY